MGISHKREIVIKRGRNRKKRSKTFKTQEAAKAYAEKSKLKNYKVVAINEHKKEKKFKVVSE